MRRKSDIKSNGLKIAKGNQYASPREADKRRIKLYNHC
jgi:hypothetical protein